MDLIPQGTQRTPQELWGCAAVSGTRMLMADPLGDVGCTVVHPRSGGCPMGALFDFDLGNFEARTTTSTSLRAKPHTSMHQAVMH